MRNINCRLLVLSVALLVTGVSSAQALKVVSTFSVIGDWVANVAGESVELVVLVGADADSHGYEPTPRDMVVLGSADLVFENGLGFEAWLDALYAASGSRARRVAVTQGLEPISAAAGPEPHDDRGDEAHNEERDHGGLDPHAWHDVRNAVTAVGVIRDALSEADPANAAAYRANATAYLAELEALDAYVRQATGSLPGQRRKLVTNHDTFGYFARAYGFEVVGTLLPRSTDSGDAAAGDLAALTDAIREAGVPVVFVENVANRSLAERVAREAGAAVAPPLYTDALGAPGSAGDTYLRMVRHNVEVMVEALGR